MTLPYPREVETGQLRPRPRAPRRPFDISARVREAIRRTGSGVELFGVEYAVDDPERADALVERWREVVTRHMHRRVVAPTARTWQLFADQVSAQLDHYPELDDAALDMMQLTIDSL